MAFAPPGELPSTVPGAGPSPAGVAVRRARPLAGSCGPSPDRGTEAAQARGGLYPGRRGEPPFSALGVGSPRAVWAPAAGGVPP